MQFFKKAVYLIQGYRVSGSLPVCREVILSWICFFTIKQDFWQAKVNFFQFCRSFFINLEISFSNAWNLVKDTDYFTGLAGCHHVAIFNLLVLLTPGRLNIVSPFVQMIFLFFLFIYLWVSSFIHWKCTNKSNPGHFTMKLVDFRFLDMYELGWILHCVKVWKNITLYPK